MKKKTLKNFSLAVTMFAVFVLWTLAVCFIDKSAIGPEGTKVGFARINGFFHEFTGIHLLLYDITDWLSIIPLCFVLGFALLGLIQWIKRKRFLKVDCSILLLGGYYIVVMAVYLFFEKVVINYRPVLINGCLEASYPSSTTMLVLCVMPTVIYQQNERISDKRFRKILSAVIYVFIIFMVTLRLISGVHWLSDIIGGILLSASLLRFFRFFADIQNK